ncbi:MAG: phosphoenolpyruvate--protein phosphotransferase [Gammaproteobacteria bacterium]|nr:phosphoenolpyruvate--protein phosphotransferase [Gammaproteobacteria bacterium]
MTETLRGMAVAAGVVLGQAHVIRRDRIRVREDFIPKAQLGREIDRYKDALRRTRGELKEIRRRIRADNSAGIADFLDAHLLMLKDSALASAPADIIKERQCNAEWALHLQRERLLTAFEGIADPYLRARKDDVEHVVERVLRNLLGLGAAPDAVTLPAGAASVVVVEDISPTDLLALHQQGVIAVICESGGLNSHSAILARGLGISAVFGVHEAGQRIHHGDDLIVDGGAGIIYVAPDQSLSSYYQQRRQQQQRELAALRQLRDLPARTVDGQLIMLRANVELAEDVEMIAGVNADGIGLYRTEMMFLGRREPPGEQEQFALYRRVVEEMAGRPVTFRTLDVGADKPLGGAQTPRAGAAAINPALGLRAVRWYLQEPEIFQCQVRAILRASALGPVRLLLPMLTTLGEVIQIRALIRAQQDMLQRAGIDFDARLAIGGMIEVPAAALLADVFARHLDFLSIGTNDLIQYTLAADRLDEEVNYLCDPLQPAILRLIALTIQAGAEAGVPVALCGEMAGDPRYTRLLLGMGLREFSMTPAMLPRIKQIILTTRLADTERRVQELWQKVDSDEIAVGVDNLNVGI